MDWADEISLCDFCSKPFRRLSCLFEGTHLWDEGKLICGSCLNRRKDCLFNFRHKGRNLWYDRDWIYRWKNPHGHVIFSQDEVITLSPADAQTIEQRIAEYGKKKKPSSVTRFAPMSSSVDIAFPTPSITEAPEPSPVRPGFDFAGPRTHPPHAHPPTHTHAHALALAHADFSLTLPPLRQASSAPLHSPPSLHALPPIRSKSPHRF